MKLRRYRIPIGIRYLRDFIAEVKTTSGFRRDRDTILVIFGRHVPYVVVCFFVEFVDT